MAYKKINGKCKILVFFSLFSKKRIIRRTASQDGEKQMVAKDTLSVSKFLSTKTCTGK